MKKRNISIFSVDLGYDTVKMLTGNKKISFPSLAEKESTGVLKDISISIQNKNETKTKASQHDRDKMIIKLKDNNDKYSIYRVGNYVLNQNSSTISYSLSEAKHQETEEIAKLLAGLSALEQKSDYIHIKNLVTGLPIKYHSKYKADFKNRLEDNFEFKLKNTKGNFVSKKVKINKVTVIPQALASFYDYIMNDKGLVSTKLEKGVGILDVGGLTVDAVAFNDGELVKDSTISFSYGVRKRVFEKIQNSLTIDISQDVIKNCIIAGQDYISIRNNKYDFKEIKEEAVDAMAKDIALHIKNRWEDMLMIDRILITGGASILLYDKLNEYLPNFPCKRINKNPQFSNCRGYLKLGKALKREKRKEAKQKIKESTTNKSKKAGPKKSKLKKSK